MGCMRFPMCGEKETDIDIPSTREMFRYAFDSGINYFDTAYMYHGGESERVTGRLLAEYPRASFYLASKFPSFSRDLFENKEQVFESQLEKCGVDYFDFYLFHCVTDENIDNFLNPEFGLKEYIKEQKAKGRIRHIGFSSHCSFDTFMRFFNYYGELIEFCQLQINWLDWEYQEANKKVAVLKEKGIPVWVMEPVRGGALVNLKPNFEKRLRELNPSRKNAEWAFRFLQGIPEIAVILSGMSDMTQLRENIETFKERLPLNDEERDTLLKIGRDMTRSDALPCTGCGYCLSKCPKELDIPVWTEAYNEFIYEGEGFARPEKKTTPADCISCRACEKVCPQNIKISEMMTRFNTEILK